MELTALWPILLTALVPMPIGTDRRRLCTPWATIGIIIINIVVFLVLRPDSPLGDASLLKYGLVPGHPLSPAFVTSLFIHVSMLHLLWNMAFLLFFGSHVEDALGSVAFMVLYVGSGVTASLCHLVICLLLAGSRPDLLSQPLVGASGAISGLIAPYAIRYYRSRLRLVWLPGYLIGLRGQTLGIPALAVLVLWLLQNVFGAINGAVKEAGGVAYWAHLGGFAFGLIIAEATGLLRDGRAEYLLADARSAAVASGGTSPAAIQSFREYVALCPGDWRVKLELALALRGSGTPGARRESMAIVSNIVKQKLAAGSDGLSVYAEALRLDLTVDLSSRERLRLAGLAQDAGHADLARGLLGAIVKDTADAPEAEMALLKLGQLLLRSDPVSAQALLTDFVFKYPGSAWIERAEDLLAEARNLTGNTRKS